MGRRDAVATVLEVVARCRQILPALRVDFLAGWETRGNGTSANYEGGIVHHTAFLSSLANPFPAKGTLTGGRPGLPGPLANFGGPVCTLEAPVLAVVAAHPANHAGASGGPSMGPLPVTTLFNPRVLGLEIDYSGFAPMTAGQFLVAKVWARAVAEVVGGGDIERVRAHAETSVTGKWDIGVGNGKAQTYNMAEFRRGAWQITSIPAPAAALEAAVRIAVTPDKTCWFITDLDVTPVSSIYTVNAVAKTWGVPIIPLTREEVQDNINTAAQRAARIAAVFAKAMPVPDVDEEAILAGLLPPMLARVDEAVPLTEADLQALLDDSEIDTVRLMAERLAGSQG